MSVGGGIGSTLPPSPSACPSGAFRPPLDGSIPSEVLPGPATAAPRFPSESAVEMSAPPPPAGSSSHDVPILVVPEILHLDPVGHLRGSVHGEAEGSSQYDRLPTGGLKQLGGLAAPSALSGHRMAKSLASLFGFILVGSLILHFIFQACHNHASKSEGHRQSTVFALGVISPLSSLGVALSPLPLILTSFRSQFRPETFPLALFISIGIANIVGIEFGRRIADLPLIATNVIALICQYAWLTSFAYLNTVANKIHPSVDFWLRQASKLAGATGILWAAMSLCSNDTLSFLMTISTVALCLAPIPSLRTMLASNKPVDFSAAMILVMMACQNAAWTLYGYFIEQNAIFLPSAFGYLIVMFQVFVCVSVSVRSPLFDASAVAAAFRIIQAGPATSPPQSPDESPRAAAGTAVWRRLQKWANSVGGGNSQARAAPSHCGSGPDLSQTETVEMARRR